MVKIIDFHGIGNHFQIYIFCINLACSRLGSGADIFLKKWSIENKNYLLIIGLLIYFVGTIFWAFSLKYELLSKAGPIFTILNLVMIVLVGVIMFKENLSFVNTAGVVLGIVSIILIEI